VSREEQSLAIGKGGQNVRLAAKLTGWKIDIVSDGETLAEADQEGTLTKEGILTDETLDEQVDVVLSEMNVTEDVTPKNAEIENAVEEVAAEDVAVEVAEEDKTVAEATEEAVEKLVEETPKEEETK
jgi:N utilization substance protein A